MQCGFCDGGVCAQPEGRLSRDTLDDGHDRCYSVHPECASGGHCKQSVWLEQWFWGASHAGDHRDRRLSVRGSSERECGFCDNPFTERKGHCGGKFCPVTEAGDIQKREDLTGDVCLLADSDMHLSVLELFDF